MVTRIRRQPNTTAAASARARVQRAYIIEGSVVERASGRGVRGVRVEAWDRDTRYHDLLGQVITDLNGAFTIAFDSVYFGDYAPDRAPDLYFKVFQDDLEILSTFERPQTNLQKGSTRVRLEIDHPGAQTGGKDFIRAEQTLKALDWWQASDFRGLWRQGSDKLQTVGKLAGALASDTLKNFDFEPIQPKSTPERDIIGHNQDSARAALGKQGIEVSNVKPIADLRHRADLKTLKAYPLRLKAQDRITLYQDEQGLIQYYTVDTPPQDADTETLTRIDRDVQSVKDRVAAIDALRSEIAANKDTSNELAAARSQDSAKLKEQSEEIKTLKTELESLRKASANKDNTIAKLQTDLKQIRSAQDQLAGSVAADRIHALELAVAKLNRGNAPSPAPSPARKTVTKTAKKAAKKASTKTARKRTPS